MCSDTKRLEMLIVLHICSFLVYRMIVTIQVLVTVRLSFRTIILVNPERRIATFLGKFGF